MLVVPRCPEADFGASSRSLQPWTEEKKQNEEPSALLNVQSPALHKINLGMYLVYLSQAVNPKLDER
ncbi:hypothetical protein AV530_005494 [Patagioenas fasciata monilis]|uniref:Uncharacterized protein n=1 Tax=Patagioenas fasciata monilis TaxID=372326 RepID=A0A1V4JLL0_PATFA|nr:hypothetical protein AV530_005494 [Patagioenas fasciata monilis]